MARPLARKSLAEALRGAKQAKVCAEVAFEFVAVSEGSFEAVELVGHLVRQPLVVPRS